MLFSISRELAYFTIYIIFAGIFLNVNKIDFEIHGLREQKFRETTFH